MSTKCSPPHLGKGTNDCGPPRTTDSRRRCSGDPDAGAQGTRSCSGRSSARSKRERWVFACVWSFRESCCSRVRLTLCSRDSPCPGAPAAGNRVQLRPRRVPQELQSPPLRARPTGANRRGRAWSPGRPMRRAEGRKGPREGQASGELANAGQPALQGTARVRRVCQFPRAHALIGRFQAHAAAWPDPEPGDAVTGGLQPPKPVPAHSWP